MKVKKSSRPTQWFVREVTAKISFLEFFVSQNREKFCQQRQLFQLANPAIKFRKLYVRIAQRVHFMNFFYFIVLVVLLFSFLFGWSIFMELLICICILMMMLSSHKGIRIIILKPIWVQRKNKNFKKNFLWNQHIISDIRNVHGIPIFFIRSDDNNSSWNIEELTVE